MRILDVPPATGATAPLPSLDGRPSPGAPGGSGPLWSATDSFFSLLAQCGQPSATATETTAPVAAPVPAMPFFGAPPAKADPESAVEAASPTAAESAVTAVASLPVMVVAEPVVNTLAAAEAAAGETAENAGESTASSALAAWPHPTAGPVAAARPVKAPILAGYRPWIAPDPETPAGDAAAPVKGATQVTPDTSSASPGRSATPVATAPRPPDETADAAPIELPATPAPPDEEATNELAPPPATAMAAAESGPAPELPTAVVAAADGPAADAQPRDGHPRRDRQEHEAAASSVINPATATAVDGAATVNATNPTLTLATLMRAVDTGATAVPTAATPTNDLDAATGASIRAQLLAEVAAQSAGATGHERIVLQLEPEHLGKVQVQLQANGSRLEIVVQAQNPESEHALAEGAQELVEAIIGHGEGRWQQVDVRFERSSGEREQRQSRDDTRSGGEQRRGNQQGRQRDERAGG